MGGIRQLIAVTLLNLKTVPQRLGSSIVGVVGIAGVVVVLVAVLSIAEGFDAVLRDAGSPARVVVMRSGSTSEMTSGLGGPCGRRHQAGAGPRAHRPDGRGLSGAVRDHRSAEEVDRERPRTCRSVALSLSSSPCAIRRRLSRAGCSSSAPTRSSSAARRPGSSPGSTSGSEIRSGQVSWKVVGMFESDGSVAETEIWCDARTLQGAYRRGNSYQSVLARLDSPDAFDTAKELADLESAGAGRRPARA